MHRSGRLLAASALLAIAVFVSCTSTSSGPDSKDVILATTTSTYDSGLLDLLVPDFEARTGYRVKTIAVGSGRALAMGERGEADVLLVHAPEREKELVREGAAVSRTLVMHNFFTLVGPSADPAGVRAQSSVFNALRRIAATDSLFMSRGDDSGTHQMEKRLWAGAGITSEGSWIQESGQGMGATLGIASEKSGYTLTDMGTYLALRHNLHLEAVMGQDPELLNTYSVLELSHDRFPKVNSAGGRAFAEYLVSPEAQAIIEGFGIEEFGSPLFFPDAGKIEDELRG